MGLVLVKLGNCQGNLKNYSKIVVIKVNFVLILSFPLKFLDVIQFGTLIIFCFCTLLSI